MAINLKALHALQAVLTEGTVTAAAERLHRTQPAVSRLVAQLESSVGFPLFTREGRRLIPTAEGLAFYRDSERALASLAEIEGAARNLREGRSAPLRVVGQSHVVHGLLQHTLEAFCARHPSFRVAIEIRQREYISHWIANQQFDVGFAPSPVDHPRIQTELLVRAPLFIALPAKHPLAAKRALGISHLAGEPLIGTRPGSPIRTRLDALFAAAGLTAQIRVETASSMSACQLAARAVGLALTDPFITSVFEGDPSVVFRPLADGLEMDYLVLRPAGRSASPLAEEFVAAVKASARERVSGLARAARPAGGGSSRDSAAKRSPSRR